MESSLGIACEGARGVDMESEHQSLKIEIEQPKPLKINKKSCF